MVFIPAPPGAKFNKDPLADIIQNASGFFIEALREKQRAAREDARFQQQLALEGRRVAETEKATKIARTRAETERDVADAGIEDAQANRERLKREQQTKQFQWLSELGQAGKIIGPDGQPVRDAQTLNNFITKAVTGATIPEGFSFASVAEQELQTQAVRYGLEVKDLQDLLQRGLKADVEGAEGKVNLQTSQTEQIQQETQTTREMRPYQKTAMRLANIKSAGEAVVLHGTIAQQFGVEGDMAKAQRTGDLSGLTITPKSDAEQLKVELLAAGIDEPTADHYIKMRIAHHPAAMAGLEISIAREQAKLLRAQREGTIAETARGVGSIANMKEVDNVIKTVENFRSDAASAVYGLLTLREHSWNPTNIEITVEDRINLMTGPADRDSVMAAVTEIASREAEQFGIERSETGVNLTPIRKSEVVFKTQEWNKDKKAYEPGDYTVDQFVDRVVHARSKYAAATAAMIQLIRFDPIAAQAQLDADPIMAARVQEVLNATQGTTTNTGDTDGGWTDPVKAQTDAIIRSLAVITGEMDALLSGAN